MTDRPFLSRLRRLAPLLLGVGLFGLGLYALHRMLAPLDPHAIFDSMASTPWPRLAGAVALTGLGYVAMAGYDFWALAWLGKRLPLRAVALGGLLGYAIGNTVGIGVLSGGAVRYRVYSAFGLSAFDVAALSSYVSVAIGLGLTLVGLWSLTLAPGALAGLLPLASGSLQLLALVAAAALTGLLFWLSAAGHGLRFRDLSIAMPRPGLLAGQVLVAFIDCALAACVLWLLLPAGAPGIGTLLPIYAVAVMAAILSHVPGGVGVFETVILAAMPAGLPSGEVAAALLLYRLIYFLLPFAIAFLTVAFLEARAAGGVAARLFGEVSAPMRPVITALGGIVPRLAGVWAMVFGAYLIAVALAPSVRPADMDADLVGAILLEGGSALSAVAGMVLMLLAHGLFRRVTGAYWLTFGALALGALAGMLNADTSVELLYAAAALALLPFRSEFYRQARITDGLYGPGWVALMLGMILSAATFFFLVHQATPYSQSLWLEFSHGSNTSRALRAGLLASALLLAFCLYLGLRPRRSRHRPAAPDTLAAAALIVDAQNDPQACMILSGDKTVLIDETGRACLGFAQQGRSRVVYSDPAGDPAAVRDLAWSFTEECAREGARPVFYEVSARYLPLWIEMGLSMHKIGEEAVIDLATFSLGGSRFKTMRAAYNKSRREGLALDLLPRPHPPERLAELKAISDAWLAGKSGAEKGFSVGRFDADWLGRADIAVIRHDGRAIAFASLMAPGDGRHVAIDLMRYLPEADGIMEFLFLSLIEHLQARGAAELSLGMVPLSGLSESPTAPLTSRFGHLIFRHGRAFYNFEGLRTFKSKFRPDWRPRYVALAPGLSPLVALTDTALLIAGGGRALVRAPRPPRQSGPELSRKP